MAVEGAAVDTLAAVGAEVLAAGILAAVAEDSAVVTPGVALWAVLAREAQRPAARSVGTRGPAAFAAMRGLPVRSARGARGDCGLLRRQELAAWDLVVRGARSSPITQVWEATLARAEPEREIRLLAETVADSAAVDMAMGATDSDMAAWDTADSDMADSVTASAADLAWA
jgi:hypothetical protein